MTNYPGRGTRADLRIKTFLANAKARRVKVAADRSGAQTTDQALDRLSGLTMQLSITLIAGSALLFGSGITVIDRPSLENARSRARAIGPAPCKRAPAGCLHSRPSRCGLPIRISPLRLIDAINDPSGEMASPDTAAVCCCLARSPVTPSLSRPTCPSAVP